MLDYPKVLQLYFEGMSQRTISPSTEYSRNTVYEIVRRPRQFDLKQLDDMIPRQADGLAGFLFPEKQATE